MTDRIKTEDKLMLAIDTSCDDTSIAVTEGFKVLSSVISSQDDLHKQWGGVVPGLARRAHAERIDAVLAEALQRAGKIKKRKLTVADMSAIGVTYGPGLAIALEIGIRKAKELAAEFRKPLIAVNHQEGHLLSALAANSKGKAMLNSDELEFPAIGLLISGGTTQLVLVKALGNYEIIGEKLDDAIGEAYDKVARMLGLGYPGGKTLTEFAKRGNPAGYKFPVPMSRDPQINFSYSGLKTAVYYLVKKMTEEKALSKQQIYDLAASFEYAAIEHLKQKLELAVLKYNPKLVLLGGGVASSPKVRSELRKMLRKHKLRLFYPLPGKMFVDNAAMVGIAANLKFVRGQFSDVSLDRVPRAEITQKY
jgi:N6-L-threonylcarbamoyladenine synthase